ncbi:hypothetical protein OAO01_02980 [Oligoflexia bacterium]|nr:hypothetical protein [Oligoflexia bacterium]
MKLTTKRNNQGIILPLLALLLVVLMGLAALAIGISFVASTRTQFQNVVNVVAPAVLQYYIDNKEDLPEAQLRVEAVKRGNFIAAQNKLNGISQPLGELEYNSFGLGGRVRFGRWHESGGTTTPAGCSTFPCEEIVDVTKQANTVTVEMNTQPGNEVKTFFTKLFGKELFALSANATSTVVKSCTVFLLDLSLSTSDESHAYPFLQLCQRGGNIPGTNEPCPNQDPTTDLAWQIMDPAKIAADKDGNIKLVSQAALQAFYTSKTHSSDNLPPNCLDPIASAKNPETIIYCNLPDKRSDYDDAEGVGLHFKSDYVPQLGAMGTIAKLAVDRSQKGLPFDYFMFAANTAGRMEGGLPVNNEVAFNGFMGDAISTFPEMVNGELPLTGAVGAFAQMTNVYFGGKAKEDELSADRWGVLHEDTALYPNYIDGGFVARTGPPNATAAQTAIYSGTNYVKAIKDAIGALDKCSTGAQKRIIALGDGISTCTVDASNNPVCTPPANKTRWDLYKEAEIKLLDSENSDGVLTMLTEGHITFSMVLASKQVGPNYLDQETDTNSGIFFTISEALAGELGGRKTQGGECDPNDSIVDCASYDTTVVPPLAIDEETAFNNVINNQPGFIFGAPNGVFAQLAHMTGGFLLPVLEDISSGSLYIDDDSDYTAGDECPHTAGEDLRCCMDFLSNPIPKDKTPCVLNPTIRSDETKRQIPEYYLGPYGQISNALLAAHGNPYKIENPQIVVNGGP